MDQKFLKKIAQFMFDNDIKEITFGGIGGKFRIVFDKKVQFQNLSRAIRGLDKG